MILSSASTSPLAVDRGETRRKADLDEAEDKAVVLAEDAGEAKGRPAAAVPTAQGDRREESVRIELLHKPIIALRRGVLVQSSIVA